MMSVVLVMFKADGTRRDFPVSKPSIIVGRKNNCDLRVPLSSVSRHHCELLLEDDAVVLKDLGSSNGTFCNDKRVQETDLEPGDRISIGPVVFTVVIDGEPGEIEPVRSVLEDPNENNAGNTMIAPSPVESPREVSMSDDDDDPLQALERLAGDE